VEGWPGRLEAPGAPALALNRTPAAALRTLSSRQFSATTLCGRLRRLGWFFSLPEDAPAKGLLPAGWRAASIGGHFNQVSLH